MGRAHCDRFLTFSEKLTDRWSRSAAQRVIRHVLVRKDVSRMRLDVASMCDGVFGTSLGAVFDRVHPKEDVRAGDFMRESVVVVRWTESKTRRHTQLLERGGRGETDPPAGPFPVALRYWA